MPAEIRQAAAPGIGTATGGPAHSRRASERSDGVAANARITAGAAVILLVLLAAEGATIPFLGSLLDAHILIGMIIVPPLLVKLASTGYRFVRYYTGSPQYRAKGAPPAMLRLLAPLVVVLSVVLVASGIALLWAPLSWRHELAFVHKASFVIWFAAMTVHVLAHVIETAKIAPRDWYGNARRQVAGAGWRQWLMVISLVLGGLLALATASSAASYHRLGDASASKGRPPKPSSSSEPSLPGPTSTTGSSPTTTAAPTTSLPIVTVPTTTKPTVASGSLPPADLGVGIRSIRLVDRTRPTMSYATSPPTEVSSYRVVDTEVRYPTAGSASSPEVPGATPAYAAGPYPVIVFAMGYAVMPDTYRPLLDAWVRAGFVVISPVFAVTNYYAWQREGSGSAPELDMPYQPGDIAFVIDQVAAAAAGERSYLHGLVDMKRLGLAGQSDGATDVGGLVWATPLRSVYASMADRPLAVAVLSGQAFPVSYSAPAGVAPYVLSTESNSDTCNPTQDATGLYGQVAALASRHWFLTFYGATHLGPYAGVSPWAEVAAAATTAFFRLTLDRTAGSLAALGRAGDVPGVAGITDAPTMSLPPTSSDECGAPTPEPLGNG
jgi:hypothetical protein